MSRFKWYFKVFLPWGKIVQGLTLQDGQPVRFKIFCPAYIFKMRPQFVVCGNMNIAGNSDMRHQVFLKINGLLKRLKPLCSLLGRPDLGINGAVLVAMAKKVKAINSK